MRRDRDADQSRYTSHEVRYQLEDSGARAIVCQDILHEKVEVGAALDHVVVTNVNEYLPALKRLFTKKTELRGRVHWLQDLLKKYPRSAGRDDRAEDRPRGAAVHRRDDRQPEGRDAHALQLGRGADHGTGRFPVFEPGKEVILRSCRSSISTDRS